MKLMHLKGGGGLFQVATTERDIIIRFHIPDLETTSINGELKVDF